MRGVCLRGGWSLVVKFSTTIYIAIEQETIPSLSRYLRDSGPAVSRLTRRQRDQLDVSCSKAAIYSFMFSALECLVPW